MRNLALTILFLFQFLMHGHAQDANNYIYLCFGQSNMEGNAQEEAVDKSYVDPRFQMLATTKFDNPSRQMGEWYTAYPPLISPMGHLSVADYFGRTMVAVLPHDVKVGVVCVAMGGAKIEMFDKDQTATVFNNPDDWSTKLATWYYDKNPYQRLVDMAKKAQQKGVIKGILLHQGESNCMDAQWTAKVKKIYNDLLADLNLKAEDVPLFAGEVLDAKAGGACAGHNSIIAQLPGVIPTAHVVRSNGCEGREDKLHFLAASYRTMGKRYAFAALKELGVKAVVNPENTIGDDMKKFLTVSKVDMPEKVDTKVGYGSAFPVSATFEDGHTEDISGEIAIDAPEGSPLTIVNGQINATDEVVGKLNVSYTDLFGQQTAKDVEVSVRFFPFNKENISAIWDTSTYDEATRTFDIKAYGQAGWQYENGVDLSQYKYLVVKLQEKQTCGADFRIFDKPSIWGASEYIKAFDDATQLVIPLAEVRHGDGSAFNLKQVRIVDFWCAGGKIKVEDVYLTNNADFTPSGISMVSTESASTGKVVYSITGQRLGNLSSTDFRNLPKGIYIVNGKKVAN